MEYQDFEPEHLDGVLALCRAEGWPSLPADPPRALRALTAPGVRAVVAVEAGAVAGFAYGQSDGEIQAHLSVMVVGAAFRRRGVGRRLVAEVFARTGAQRIDLFAEADAVAFYRSFAHVEGPAFRLYPGRRTDGGAEP